MIQFIDFVSFTPFQGNLGDSRGVDESFNPPNEARQTTRISPGCLPCQTQILLLFGCFEVSVKVYGDHRGRAVHSCCDLRFGAELFIECVCLPNLRRIRLSDGRFLGWQLNASTFEIPIDRSQINAYLAGNLFNTDVGGVCVPELDRPFRSFGTFLLFLARHGSTPFPGYRVFSTA